MKTKEKILSVALEMFNETNTQAATTNHIAKKMGISPGNLHYHYSNREEIIRLLYKQMHQKLSLPIEDLPKNIAELIEHQKVILTVSYEYRFFYNELIFLLSRDEELKKVYTQDNIAHLERIKQVLKNFVHNGELTIPFDNIIDYIAESILMTFQFWNPFLLTLGKELNETSIIQGIERSNEIMRPFLSDKALKALAKTIS